MNSVRPLPVARQYRHLHSWPSRPDDFIAYSLDTHPLPTPAILEISSWILSGFDCHYGQGWWIFAYSKQTVSTSALYGHLVEKQELQTGQAGWGSENAFAGDLECQECWFLFLFHLLKEQDKAMVTAWQSLRGGACTPCAWATGLTSSPSSSSFFHKPFQRPKLAVKWYLISPEPSCLTAPPTSSKPHPPPLHLEL